VTFRFVHTADLHLDSPLVSLALRDPVLAAEVGVASRTALTRIVDLCLAEAVDNPVLRWGDRRGCPVDGHSQRRDLRLSRP